jgi:hypothetical protein
MQYYAKLPDLESTETMFKNMTEQHEILPDARSYMVPPTPPLSSSLSLLYAPPHRIEHTPAALLLSCAPICAQHSTLPRAHGQELFPNPLLSLSLLFCPSCYIHGQTDRQTVSVGDDALCLPSCSLPPSLSVGGGAAHACLCLAETVREHMLSASLPLSLSHSLSPSLPPSLPLSLLSPSLLPY